MDKFSVSRLIKSCIFVILALVTFDAFAGYVYVGPSPRPGAVWTCGHRSHHHYVKGHYVYGDNCGCALPYYYGPDCCGYYFGQDCCTVLWVPCHWNTYGHYVPGYWTAFRR